ncbi:hypothetical protein ACHHV8_25555 [Paenibacillus sp. TAB 01]|uniref:hypothetical protein n=1 Tax=Paenibacillus sp. TAB 01 TaxID=3368988 RepID=UPI0037511B55
MKKVEQLLSNEANLIEAMRAGKDVKQAAQAIGITREAAYLTLRRLVQFGLIQRTGHKKNYRYTILDKPYEVVKRRSALGLETEGRQADESLEELMNTHFTPGQLDFYKNHSELDRRGLAKQIGMTKTQLNFAIINAGLGSGEKIRKQK